VLGQWPRGVAARLSEQLSFNVLHSQYADDTQLYLSLNSVNAQSAMDECFKAVHRWFTFNGFALNPDKSKAIVVGTGARRRQEGAIGSVSLDGVNIPVSECVRSLGVTLDSTMSFDGHVDNICKTSFHHVRALRRIRKFITTDNAKNIATAVVGSSYCNSLLYGVSETNLNKLQCVENSMAHIVLGSDNSKIAFLTFKTLTTERTTYLSELLQFRTTPRLLRSSDRRLLHDAGAKTVFGSRAFCHVAPSVWNSLPPQLTADFNSVFLFTFKCNLKTHFYRLSFKS